MGKKKIITYLFSIILILIASYFFYYHRTYFLNLNIIQTLNDYLGLMILPVALFIFLFCLLLSRKKTIERLANEIRLYFFLLLCYSLVFSFIIYTEKIISIDYDTSKNLINLSLYKYKIGYVGAYMLYYITNLPYPFKNIMLSLYASNFILLFLIIFKPLKNYIKTSIEESIKRRKMIREETELMEQIKIKEFLEEQEITKIKKLEDSKTETRNNKINELKALKNKKTKRAKKQELKLFMTEEMQSKKEKLKEKPLKTIINVDED